MHTFPVIQVEDILDVYRHWHARSQKYAGGDSLATALHLGWELKPVVFTELHWFSGARHNTIFHFELTRDGENQSMSVISTPYVEKLIAERDLQIVPLSRQKPARVRLGRRPASYGGEARV